MLPLSYGLDKCTEPSLYSSEIEKETFKKYQRASQLESKGLENEENRREVIQLYTDISEKIPAAANSLGAIYELYENNLKTAYHFYQIAANQGYPLGKENIERIHEEYNFQTQERKKTPPSISFKEEDNISGEKLPLPGNFMETLQKDPKTKDLNVEQVRKVLTLYKSLLEAEKK